MLTKWNYIWTDTGVSYAIDCDQVPCLGGGFRVRLRLHQHHVGGLVREPRGDRHRDHGEPRQPSALPSRDRLFGRGREAFSLGIP